MKPKQFGIALSETAQIINLSLAIAKSYISVIYLPYLSQLGACMSPKIYIGCDLINESVIPSKGNTRI